MDGHVVEVKRDILAQNRGEADELREELAGHGCKLVNVMASPGAGKTTTILATIAASGIDRGRFAVVEGDIESFVDSHKVKEAGVRAVQINTGGACHLDISMVRPALELLDLDACDAVFVENIGNLVCPAEFDIGEALKLMILSVPEGHDKVLKYPLMFSVADVVLVNKTDYLALPTNDFDLQLFEEYVRRINPAARIFAISALTGEGMQEWAAWFTEWLAS